MAEAIALLINGVCGRMGQRVFAIALNTYRECVRARILLGLAGAAFAFALYSNVVAAFTLKSGPRVVADLGAASISLFGKPVWPMVSMNSRRKGFDSAIATKSSRLIF